MLWFVVIVLWWLVLVPGVGCGSACLWVVIFAIPGVSFEGGWLWVVVVGAAGCGCYNGAALIATCTSSDELNVLVVLSCRLGCEETSGGRR